MLEYWNIGFWDNGIVALENQKECNNIDFLIIAAYFLGQKQKIAVWGASLQNLDTTFFVE